MKARMKISLATLEVVKQELAALPELRPAHVSRRIAIRMLKPQIEALRHRGYDMEEIAKLLSDRGLVISPSVLKTYVSSKAPPRRKRRSEHSMPSTHPVHGESEKTTEIENRRKLVGTQSDDDEQRRKLVGTQSDDDEQRRKLVGTQPQVEGERKLVGTQSQVEGERKLVGTQPEVGSVIALPQTKVQTEPTPGGATPAVQRRSAFAPREDSQEI